MGRIKKVAAPRHEATLSHALSEFIKIATTVPLYQLPAHLASFPHRWPFPRGDLYHWIPVLDRFDLVLELFNEEYGLSAGPQVKPFERRILLRSQGDESSTTVQTGKSNDELLDAAKSFEGDDSHLVEQILYFTRILLENCGNRSLYSSSSHLNNLLNTTSLPLLKATLRLCLRLAQRYHASRMRLPSMSQQHPGLLNSHYNINLEKLHKLSLPFLKHPLEESVTSPSKGKEPALKSSEGSHSMNVTDLVSIVKSNAETESEWQSLANVWLNYYEPSHRPDEETTNGITVENVFNPGTSSQPATARRSSNLGPHGGGTQSQPGHAEEQTSTTLARASMRQTEQKRGPGSKQLLIPHNLVTTTQLEELLKIYVPDLPPESHYELLTKLRISHAFGSSAMEREDVVCIRLLAIANLAYIHPESIFQQKFGQQDSDEPRRLQLASQLSELLHPPRENEHEVSREVQTLALSTLEALTKHKSKASDVSHALSVSVNHGVLFYLLRKAAAELGVHNGSFWGATEEEWREALYSLLMSLPSTPNRTGESMVSAGLLDILIGILRLRTSRAERYFYKVLTFFDTYIYNIRDAFQALVTAEGLDVIADLFAYQVGSAVDLVERGEGFPENFRTQVTDFQIPFNKQQTLRWLVKFTNHMLTHGAGGFDRLLRNLVSAPHLLDGLRIIIGNARVFGSSIWSGAVNVMSSFIHNEPTSYAIIAEAGLSKAFLESVTQESIPDPSPPNAQSSSSTNSTDTETNARSVLLEPDNSGRLESALSPQSHVPAQGILPSAETLQTLPQAFGAICLIETGMRLFQSSKALSSFFEIFQSPEHVKAMMAEQDLPFLLGNLFDELVRHHPQLKTAVLDAVLTMVLHVTNLCFNRALVKGVGAKLWIEGGNGKPMVAGGRDALLGQEGPLHSQYRLAMQKSGNDAMDIEMPDADAGDTRDEGPEASSDDVVDTEDPSQGPRALDHINVATRFLNGLFQNNSLCSAFIEQGGVEHALDLATLPCWPHNFKEETRTSDWVAQMIQAMLEQKPHLVLPSITKRIQLAIDHLDPLLHYHGAKTYFTHFTILHPSIASQPELDPDFLARGTSVAKSLVTVDILCNALGKTFQSQVYNHRTMSTTFGTVNFADVFMRLIDGLGKLQQCSNWEHLMLQNGLSPGWREATQIKSSGFGIEEADELLSMIHGQSNHTEFTNGIAVRSGGPGQERPQQQTLTSSSGSLNVLEADKDKSVAQFKNVQTIRYLLSQTPTSIHAFFQGLGKMLLFKRNLDAYQKQSATLIADHLAKTTLDGLRFPRAMLTNDVTDRYSYWVICLTSLASIMIDNAPERLYPQTITLVLQSFKNHGGFQALHEILISLLQEVEQLNTGGTESASHEDANNRLNIVLAGIKLIVTFFSQTVHSKCVNEAIQTNAMASRSDRDRDKPDYFSPAQFLVEIRMAVLPSLRLLWASEDFLHKAPISVVKTVIETLRIVLQGESEHGAFKRSDRIPPRSKPRQKLWKLRSAENLTRLVDEGNDETLAMEALYRCCDSLTAAREYCKMQKTVPRASRNPIPSYELQAQSLGQVSGESSGVTVIPQPGSTTDQPENREASVTPTNGLLATTYESQTAQDDSSALGRPSALAVPSGGSTSALEDGQPNVSGSEPSRNEADTAQSGDVVTVDDLDAERSMFREKFLIDRSLDVLNAHDDVTFELADLISAAVTRAGDPAAVREEIGRTLIQSLASFQSEEDFRPQGKRIAAYAHLLALLLQDKEFFDATLDELRDNFTTLVDFIKFFPDNQPDGNPSAWIAKVLLVFERLLAESTQPHQIQWTPPIDTESMERESIVQLPEPIISQEQKSQAFTAILDVLSHVGKDESLALAIVRVLVILTRDRQLATQLGEKRALQKLFLVIKQLSGFTNERLQSAFMLILRHIVEDEGTIRQLMRSEIRAMFESRQQRQADTTSYTRQMYHLVLRAPEIFVEVTNEMLMLVRFDPSLRSQVLALKKGDNNDTEISVPGNDEPQINDERTENAGAQGSGGAGTEQSKGKSKWQDVKAPVVDKPDGVIHYLLCELLSYKDVSDKELPMKPNRGNEATPTDVDMALTIQSSSSSVLLDITTPELKKSDKAEFKADQHPIYIYRCFILQCLTELLACYNRAKVEFINFTRKADPHLSTPSKPRSRVLDYLLNTLIPIGTLSHAEDLSFRKRVSTSNWAISVVVSLCSKTGERTTVNERDNKEAEDEPELLFVRRFALEHALKAFKDASASSEPPDQKYSHLLNLSDLFNRMLTGKPNSTGSSFGVELLLASQKQLARIMFEKNFISAFTSCLSDVDLNFPGAKRAVKYILRPFKILTQTALELSASSDLSTLPGFTADEDEISTASSVSDMDDSREETPDLFRNSTLGMFEPGREEETDSASEEEDEDGYGDEYADDMEFDEEGQDGGGDVVSEEDEEIEGMDSVEGLPGDVGVEVVIEGEDEELSDDEEEEESDDLDDLDDINDEDDEMEVMDEVIGDDDSPDLAGGDDDGWASEDEDGGEYIDQDEMGDNDSPLNGDALQQIVRAIEDNEPQDLLNRMENGGLEMDIDQDDYPGEDAAEDDEDDEEEDDEYDEADVTFEAEYGEDEVQALPWGWDEMHPTLLRSHGVHHHHPHHHHHRANPWRTVLAGGANDQGIVFPAYRAHRPSGTQRGTDDGTNPLLQRSGRAASGPGIAGRIDTFSDWMDPVRAGRLLNAGESPVSFISNVINAMSQGRPILHHRHLENGGLSFTIGGLPGGASPFRGGLASNLDGILNLRRPQDVPTRTPRDDPAQAVAFVPALTASRWQDEARLLFGSNYLEKAQRVINSILRLLVPPAIDAQKAQKQEEEKREKEEAEARAKEKEEREAREKKEREEREEREVREAREIEAAARAREVAQVDQDRETQTEAEASDEDQQMEDALDAAPSASNDDTVPDAGPSESAPRVTTTIRGRELDITGMGIDMEYLEALPEELREEVLMQQVAEQRSQAVAAGEEPTDISREFLEALPADIREELLQQEAQDRRRREREEARRRNAGNDSAPVARAEEMDAASFLASLDPGLRQSVLMEQDEEILAHLPDAIRAEARALGGDRRLHQFNDMPRVGRIRGVDRFDSSQDQAPKKLNRRQVVQILDKSGVATLMRLLFIPQQGSARQSLNGVFQDICENRQNRVDLLSLLLSILQDGSIDSAALERCFVQLSLRAKQMHPNKTPQPIKRSLTGQFPLSQDMSSLTVVQNCLNTLSFLANFNPHIPFFFLTEREAIAGLRSRTARKGKTVESKAAKYPLNVLLSLLDRKIITESVTVMEQLVALLHNVTLPLNVLLKKDKEKAEDDKKKAETTGTEGNGTQGQPETETERATGAAVEPTVESGERSEDLVNDVTPNVEDKAEGQEGETSKKPRVLVSPEVPEHNLRLVVNILAARECSSRAFRDTLSMINNMSAIPGAKEIFGRELMRQAQELGKRILRDLEDLVPQISKAESGTDIQGLALSKFSPGSSDQAKLLRMMTALDYLFDPKRADTQDKPSTSNAEGLENEQKQDILITLSENSTFGPLWNKLSQCLTAIRQRGNMFNVATILLPLIEVLMVVCKNTTLKETPVIRPYHKEIAFSSPPPDGRMENMFFSFTEEHRKILNDLVRHNPRLMSGSFALLVKNSKVLEFDNKRNYFVRKLHTRGSELRHPHPPLQLAVRREQVFLDSFKSLYYKSAEEMKFGKLTIRFHGEEGVDAGGVTREWFQVLSRQMFNPDYALFIPVASDRTTFHPNRLSSVNQEHLLFFKFIGRIIGKALYEGRVLDCHFSRAVYKRILGKPVSVKDMETLDLDYYKSLLWMLENDITDIITETFSVESEAFGVTQIIDLIENGRNVSVTEENKHEYVRLVVEYRLTGSVQEQLEHFLKGFHDIVPPDLVAIFNEQELELLISGLPDIDVDDWRNNTEYQNYTAASPQIQWFWRAVRSFDKEERAKLLQFVTGTSKVPLNGFKELEGMNGVSRFNIHRDYGTKDRLPSSHTCFNQLDLPEYDSYESLRQQVYTAITAGSEYFGFA